MWIYKFSRPATRTQVPKFTTFLRQNHDLMKLTMEDVYDNVEDRFMFFLRVVRFLAIQMIQFVIVFALLKPEDGYFQRECFKR
jgi:hypothetical protein